jgi:type IV secretion system protein VirB1
LAAIRADAAVAVVELAAMLLACAPLVAPGTARALIDVESAGNPYAIGVVAGSLVRQPRNLSEALATARALEAAGWNFSVGLGQVNKKNFAQYGLTLETAFDPCSNLQAMQGILGECFERASVRSGEQAALRQAFSCYYSGNFQTGFDHGYVQRVIAAYRVGHRNVGRTPIDSSETATSQQSPSKRTPS